MKLLLVIVSLWCLTITAFASDSYFPPNSLGSTANLSAFVENWYSKQLVAMGEKPMFPSVEVQEVYRFTWLRTFHHPMVFRLNVAADGQGVLHSVENSGAGGYEPGVLLHSNTKEQSSADIVKIRQELIDIGFWNMPSQDDNHMVMDGASWIFEASINGIYHFVVRNSPMDSKYHDAMLRFMKQSGMELGEIY